MKIIGEPYSVLLQTEPAKLTNRHTLANILRIQAQEGDICYRFDGGTTMVNGFILPNNEVLEVNLSETNSALTVWSTDIKVRVRLVIQEKRA